MSLPALALLIAATGALREAASREGADWFRVEMAPHEPLDLIDGGARQVLVCTFLGDETHELRARKWFDGDRVAELVVQVLLPPIVDLTFGGERVEIDAHTAGAEGAFTAADRMIEVALGAADPGSWGEFYANLVTAHPHKKEKLVFLATSKLNVTVPAFDLSLACHVINSPAPGDVELQRVGFWPDFVAKMRSDPHVAGLADFVAALIAGRILAPWRVEQALAGVTGPDGSALGIGVFRPLTDQPPTGSLTVVGSLSTDRIADEP